MVDTALCSFWIAFLTFCQSLQISALVPISSALLVLILVWISAACLLDLSQDLSPMLALLKSTPLSLVCHTCLFPVCVCRFRLSCSATQGISQPLLRPDYTPGLHARHEGPAHSRIFFHVLFLLLPPCARPRLMWRSCSRPGCQST